MQTRTRGSTGFGARGAAQCNVRGRVAAHRASAVVEEAARSPPTQRPAPRPSAGSPCCPSSSTRAVTYAVILASTPLGALRHMADSQGTRLQLLYLHGALHIVDIVTFPRQSRDGAAVSVALSHTSDASADRAPALPSPATPVARPSLSIRQCLLSVCWLSNAPRVPLTLCPPFQVPSKRPSVTCVSLVLVDAHVWPYEHAHCQAGRRALPLAAHSG